MDVTQTTTATATRNTVYEELRPLPFSIAYQMVGSASDAEDIVQEAFLRFHREARRGTQIASRKAWLSTVTTRLAINHVQSARVRRERYVGTGLPEPLVTEPEPGSDLFGGPAVVTYDVPPLAPGSDFFRCDVHPDMSGQLTVGWAAGDLWSSEVTTTERAAALANPYVWMGLAPGASLGDVKRADRRLAMHVHPDHARLRRSYADGRSN
jgi:Sigma-70 region 2